MAASAILDNFEWPYLHNSSQSTYMARIARSSVLQHSFLVYSYLAALHVAFAYDLHMCHIPTHSAIEKGHIKLRPTEPLSNAVLYSG